MLSKAQIRQKVERVLCPVDLTEDSATAVSKAVSIATAFGAELYVCYCIEPDKEAIRDHVRGLHHIKQLLEKTNTLAPNFYWEGIIIEGEPAEAIVREASRRRVDLIVMRSRRRPYAAAILGSTAEAISRTAPCPVLISHADEANERFVINSILVGYDFSEYSDLALAYAYVLASIKTCTIYVLHVLATQQDEEVPFRYSQVLAKLKSAVPQTAGLEHVVVAGLAYREILNYAEEKKVDLICMGSRGAGFGFRALFGSNADRVLRQAPCPVLVCRPLKWSI
ncbi:MAG: universal stress protein [Acidobacteriota bacterium]|nr:universal stress protein [Blastocatellia bacterium]MDW8413074.1 universal stress protein [Acidobacteriota bacterium]